MQSICNPGGGGGGDFFHHPFLLEIPYVTVIYSILLCIYVALPLSPMQDGSCLLLLSGQHWVSGGLPQTPQPSQEENQPLREGEK